MPPHLGNGPVAYERCDVLFYLNILFRFCLDWDDYADYADEDEAYE